MTAVPSGAPAPGRRSPTVVVPDVTGQAFVFAKGTLEDTGFAWKVVGSVHGYAANKVASQTPAAGTKLKDTGAPTITVDAGAHVLSGEGRARGRLAVLPARPCRRSGSKPPPCAPARRLPAAPAAKPQPRNRSPPRRPSPRAAERAHPPSTVAGAPKEPRKEMALPQRAQLLSGWIAGASEDEGERAPLPLPAQLDRHWREVRLVARSRGTPPADRRRPRRAETVGNRTQERVRRRAARSLRSKRGASDRVGAKAPQGRGAVTASSRCSPCIVIMSIVFTGITDIFVSGSKAQADQSSRFQAQLDTRLALDKMRRDIHCASTVPVLHDHSVTLTISGCSGGNVSWCAVAGQRRLEPLRALPPDRNDLRLRRRNDGRRLPGTAMPSSDRSRYDPGGRLRLSEVPGR